MINYAVFSFILFASYIFFSFVQNRNFCPFFTTLPNFKNFHRQLSVERYFTLKEILL